MNCSGDFTAANCYVANDVLLRGAVLHADIGMFVPGDFGRYPLVQDGGRRGWRGGSSHWEVGRQLLDSIAPAPSADAGALLWYRAVSAHLFRAGNLAELATHLSRARNVFPKSPDILFDSAYSASGAVVASNTSIHSAAARRLREHRGQLATE